MANSISLLSISEILGKNFFIPSYQRGYRWTEQQVTDLLNDIYTFAIRNNKTEKEFYCLQPIVVRKCNETVILRNELNSNLDNNIWYEVIDGQQRLTSIRILLTYLIKEHLNGKSLQSEYGKDELLLEYESREGTKEFLNNINIETSTKNIDFDFIYNAYLTISNWFSKQTQQRGVRENILRTLLYDMNNKQQEGVVQVIWYDIEDNSNPIDTFIRINMGKIPLTNSELIKALFLKKQNFGNEDVANLRQIEIATEWDRIEYSLQNDDFWWFLNRQENDISARIELIFDIICEVAKKENVELVNIIGTDKYATFRYFNVIFSKDIVFDKVEEEWYNVKKYFLAFDEWFNDTVWYHYIGFLIYCGTSIVDIYKSYKNSLKNEFTSELKKLIKLKLKDVNCSKAIINETKFPGLDEIIEKADLYLDREGKANYYQKYAYNFHLQYCNKDKPQIRELLLMYNLQFIVKQYEETKKQSGQELFLRFPFELFKKDKWDVEHVDSYTTNQIIDKNTQVEWIKTTRIDIRDKLDDLKQDILDFIDSKNNAKEFEDLKIKIIEKAGESTNSLDSKNCIGNLTLLDAGTNRSYGNALFPTKRRIIIEKDNEGKFIPLCTKNVFFKYFDKEGTSRTQWTESDISKYQNNIGEILDEFLTFKANNNE